MFNFNMLLRKGFPFSASFAVFVCCFLVVGILGWIYFFKLCYMFIVGVHIQKKEKREKITKQQCKMTKFSKTQPYMLGNVCPRICILLCGMKSVAVTYKIVSSLSQLNFCRSNSIPAMNEGYFLVASSEKETTMLFMPFLSH